LNGDNFVSANKVFIHYQVHQDIQTVSTLVAYAELNLAIILSL